jgi:hypothetical protein
MTTQPVIDYVAGIAYAIEATRAEQMNGLAISHRWVNSTAGR